MGVPGISFKKRLLVILVIFTLAAAALVVRVAYIQFVQGQELQKKAFLQQNSRRTISPIRGTIYDRNGKELAISVQVGTITCNPNDIKNSKIPAEELAAGLAGILGMDQDDVLALLTKNSKYVIIKKKVDMETEDKVRQWISANKIVGINIDEDAKRYYPNGNLASHIIGFTGTDNQGLSGIESVLEKYLKGVPGKILSEVDSKGRALPLTTEKRIDAEDGLNVVLTLDETVQYLATKTLEKAIEDYKVKQGGVAIVMDPRTGEILAMVSKPDFDPNEPFAAPKGVEGIDPATWNGTSTEGVNMLNKTVWRNKAISDTYEPGSTFKSFTSAAGLEEGIVTPDTVTNDLPIELGGWTIRCWRVGREHGTESFRLAVYNSCNPVFVKVAQGLGITKFYKYLKAFGFYDKTGIGLSGEGTSVFQEQPKEIDMATASFGQRFTITPIQLITGYTAIINDGKLMKPRLVKELTDSEGNIVEKFEPEVVRTVISQETSETMRDILEGVVREPNATGNNAYVKGYRVAGKTGTSQTTKADVKIASFCGFAPADNPVISVLVVLFDPKGESYMGGAIAAPTVGKIIEDVLDYMQVERRYSEADLASMQKEIFVPDVEGKTVEEAIKELKQKGLKYILEGDGSNTASKVVYQLPKPNTSIPQDSTVILYTYKPNQEVTVMVPNLTNKTMSEAQDALKRAGLNIKVKGTGVASTQSISPGSSVARGSVIEVEFMQLDNVE
jgi:stage V sporulation protein D (sporulation-specific penicillin-binding protein)